MQRFILAQSFTTGPVCNSEWPGLFLTVAVFAVAAAVIFFTAAVYGPPLVRDIRDWYRERQHEIERADRARLQTVVNIADATRRPGRGRGSN